MTITLVSAMENPRSPVMGLVLLVLLVTVSDQKVLASDPDLTTDFGISSPNVSDFTFTGMRNATTFTDGRVRSTIVSPGNLRGLTGLGLTAVLFLFGPTSQVNPHHHPRATEIFYVLTGQVEVGFVDTASKLFTTTLEAGDLFVFPKGLIHFQRNNNLTTASGFAVQSSENPGIQLEAGSLFTSGGTGLPDIVLSRALNIDETTVRTIKAGLTPRPPTV